MRKLIVLSLAVAAGLISVATFLPEKTSGHQKSKFQRSVQPIANRYLVVLDEEIVGRSLETPAVEAEAQFLTSLYGGQVGKVFSTAVKGYVANMSPAEAEALGRDERIRFVEEDAEVSVATTQPNAGWNLDRVDQRALPLDTDFNYTNSGSGAHVYIIDTGVRTTHQEFQGRANVVFDSINDGIQDCNGHGTHVAGIVGGMTYGVAKNVSIHSARVLRCDGGGAISDIVAAIDWITAHRINPAVANISITAAGPSPTMEEAVTNSVASGVVFTVSAGNSARDACGYSPGRTPVAITVGASAQDDDRALFSNYGPCVDIFAPGYEIVSAGNTSDTAIRQLNGTSQAAPLVAGVAAIYRGANPSANANTVIQAVLNGATQGIVWNIPDTTTPNRLLYEFIGSAPPPTPTPTPTATPSPTVTPTPTPTPNSPGNGRVTVKKRVQTTSGGTSSSTAFPYAATNISTANFSLTNNQEFTDANVTANGQVVAVTENQVDGWQLISVECVEVAGGTPNVSNTTVDLANHRANIRVESGETVTCTFTSEELAPTAGDATVSGRVIDARGHGVKNISLTLMNVSTGEIKQVSTNQFGFYSFAELDIATFYVLTAIGNKKFAIENGQRTFTLVDDLVNVDFVATNY